MSEDAGLQRRAAPAVRFGAGAVRLGRVFGLDTTMSTLSMPLGMLIFAPLADVIPISLGFIIGGVLTLPIGIYLFGQARHNTSAQVTRTQA